MSHTAARNLRKHHLNLALTGMLVSVTIIYSLPARGGDMDDLLDMPLEQLLNINVSVASKHPEPILRAPASITSYSANSIAQLGYYNVAELANITPGFSSFTDIGENTLETRGARATGFDNNRHLLLIDGIPMNHLRSYALQADNHLPLYFARQVDFLRGPASALYGVSAFYGVVNITPMERQDSGQQFTLRTSVASVDKEKRLMSNYLVANDTGFGGIRVGFFSKDASEDVILDNPAHRNYDDQDSGFAYASWEWRRGLLAGFRTGILAMKKEGGLGNFWADYSSEKNAINWENFLWYIKHQAEINSRLSVNSFVKYAYAKEEATYFDDTQSLRSHYDYPFHSYEGQLELDWKFVDKQSLLFGVNYDTRYGEREYVTVLDTPAITERTPDLITQSFYLQYKSHLDFLEGTDITLGVREDHGEAEKDRYHKLSPRLALVQGINQQLLLKLLYGEALRGPSVKEVGVNREVERDNPGFIVKELSPEEITTLELAAIYQHESWMTSVTWFKNTTDSFIGRDWTNLGEYINASGDTTSKGLEFELKYLISSGNEIFMNFSRSDTEDANGDALNDIPDKKLNVGYLWQLSGGIPFSGSIVLRHIDAFTVSDSSVAEGDGYSLVDVNTNYSINQQLLLGFQISNLTDTEYYLPRQGSDFLPMPGRKFTVSMELSF